jgi:nucleoside-diphosphate-sugar epimerase
MKIADHELTAQRRITVLGATGFIGSHLARRLQELDVNLFAPRRTDTLAGMDLGDVIYCIGLTADFRSHPFETAEAHACHLLRVLRDSRCRSFVYLSSARIYERNATPAREDDAVQVSSLNPGDLYNISKLMGESLALAWKGKTAVVRLSNVYGEDFASQNFLSNIINQAVTTAKIIVETSPDSEKDYISIHDVVDGLTQITLRGQQSIYNLASGMNVSNDELTRRISQVSNCQVAFAPGGVRVKFPVINIDRMRSEFGFQPRNVLDELSNLVDSYKRHHAREKSSRL